MLSLVRLSRTHLSTSAEKESPYNHGMLVRGPVVGSTMVGTRAQQWRNVKRAELLFRSNEAFKLNIEGLEAEPKFRLSNFIW